MLLYEAIDGFLALVRMEASDDLQKIIERAAAGDQDAYGALYSKYYNDLVRVAKAITRNTADAEDAVQDVFTNKITPATLTKWLQKKRPAARLRNTLIAAVKNRAIDMSRSAHGKTHTLQPADQPHSGLGRVATSTGGRSARLSSAEKKQFATAMREILRTAKLTADERKIISTLYFDPDTLAPVKPAYGAARKAFPTLDKTKISKARSKFLKAFCTNRKMCALLPTHGGQIIRARSGAKFKCAKVPGSCVEAAAMIFGMNEQALSEDASEALLIQWVMEKLRD